MLLILLAASTPAYLRCEFPSEKAPFVVEMNMDEAAGRVTIAIPSAEAIEVRPAMFSPTKVTISDHHGTWTVDRVTLKVERALNFGAQPNIDHGTCEVKPAPAKRAF